MDAALVPGNTKADAPVVSAFFFVRRASAVQVHVYWRGC